MSSFQDLKPRLTEYVTHALEPSPAAGRGFYQCPLCGSGSREGGTGAFRIVPGGQAWKCHACGEGGDIVDLHSQVSGQPTGAAAAELAGRYGVEWTKTPSSSGVTFDLAGNNSNSRPVVPSSRKEDSRPPATTRAPQPAPPAPSVDFTPWLTACQQSTPLAEHAAAVRYLAEHGIPLEAAVAAGVVVWDGNPTAAAAWRAEWNPPDRAGRPTRFTPALIFPYEGGHYWQARNLGSSTTDRWDKPASAKAGGDPLMGAQQLQAAGAAEDRRPLVVVEGPADYLAVTAAGGRALALGTTSSRKLEQLTEHLPAGVPIVDALDMDTAGRTAAEKIQALPSRKIVNIWDYVAPPEGASVDGMDVAELAAKDEGQALAAVLELIATLPARELEAQSVGATMDAYLARADQRAREPQTPTGFPTLDAALQGGLQAGLYVVGAMSSLGKTTLALQIADQVAAAGSRPVVIFSLEQGRDELIAKSLSRISRLQSGGNAVNSLKARGLGDAMTLSEEEALARAVETYRQQARRLWIFEGVGSMGTAFIRKTVDEMTQALAGSPSPLIVVDYLQILAPSDDRLTDKQATDRAITDLKRISRDYDAPILIVSSLNRASYSGPVTMSAFKESGAIEYGTDVLLGVQPAGLEDSGQGVEARNAGVMKAHRKAKKRDVEVVVLKNRNGPVGAAVPLVFEPVFSLFQEQTEKDRQAIKRI